MRRLATLFIALLVVGLVLPADLFAQAKVVIREVPVSSRTKAAYYTGTTLKNVMYHGLRVVGIGTNVYVTADTTGSGTTTVTSFAWTLGSVPIGSNATFNSATSKTTYFNVDSVGTYIFTASVNGGAATHTDTVIASTYYGNRADTTANSCSCHGGNYTSWKATPHSSIFFMGITGQLENDPVGHAGKGAYAPACIRCHTVGHEVGANNGNFGYSVHQSGWDSAWVHAGYQYDAGDYWISPKDSSQWKLLTSPQKAVANIGCEACHGPASAHKAQTSKTPATMGVYGKFDPQMVNSGVCNQCHDAGGKHIAGTLWLKSSHSTLPASASHISSASCYPCHSGIAFVKFVNNGTGGVPPAGANAYDYNNDGAAGIGCPTCHDSHGGTYQAQSQLRTAKVDTLSNGFKVPTADFTNPGTGGTGQLCMNCHRGRTSVAKGVTTTAPYYGINSRFGPHHSPQADMFFGQNGYEYSQTLGGAGNSVHLGALTNGCVDCHMQNVSGIYSGTSSTNLSHTFEMQDTLGRDMVKLCQSCHSEATSSFSQIPAQQDYAGLGHVGTFYEQYSALLTQLAALLPKDSTGTVLGGVNTKQDSAQVANKPWLVQGLWNYAMLTSGAGNGVHNPDYSIKLLQASINAITGVIAGVKKVGNTVPARFALDQNYPNPFNPTTQISFSLPQRSSVVMEIYDMLGKRISSLVNETKDAGSYRVTWNGSNADGVKVPSGVYFYRIQAGSFTSVKKMVMLK